MGNGLNHSSSRGMGGGEGRRGGEGGYSCGYVKNGFGDSWPNVVIVGDKETARKR